MRAGWRTGTGEGCRCGSTGPRAAASRSGYPSCGTRAVRRAVFGLDAIAIGRGMMATGPDMTATKL
jgi:hypothetical protein